MATGAGYRRGLRTQTEGSLVRSGAREGLGPTEGLPPGTTLVFPKAG